MKFWIKLWIAMLADPKMASLPNDLWRRTVECFLMAGEKNEDGFLPPLTEMSWTLRMQAEHIENDLVELQKVGILNAIDGRWFVNNFAARQAPSNSSQRSKHHRIREKAKHYQGNLWSADGTRTFRPTEEKRGKEKKRRGEEKESAVTFRDADEMVQCPKCSAMIFEHALELDCAAHITYKDLSRIKVEDKNA